MVQRRRGAMRAACGIDALETRLLLAAGPRQMEYLDRGVVATRSSSNVFVSWRSLALDPANLTFNVYRSANGGAAVKLNASPLAGGTNYSDTSAGNGATNAYAYSVRPVLNGVEQPASPAYTLAANAPQQPFFTVPLRNIGNYAIKHMNMADLNGDGRYDYIVDRKPINVVNEVATESTKVEAYLHDGTFLWSVDLGPGSHDLDNIEPGPTAVDIGNWDGVVAYDMDGDGRAEVMLRSADGLTFGDGKTLANPANAEAQWLSVLDGLTGAERARTPLPTDFRIDGPLAASFAIGYLDGVHPSLVAKFKNRNGGNNFNQVFAAYDFDGATVTQRWKYLSAPVDSDNGHNIRTVDVDGDGRDEVADTAQVINGDGTLRYNLRDGTPSLGHGDRFYVGDFDPTRPGLETYGVQQNNPGKVIEFLADSATGQVLYAGYSASVTDNGRGDIGDIDASKPGSEFWSFYGLYNTNNGTTTQIGTSSPWPSLGLQWDGDLLTEVLSTDHAVIDQWNPATQGTGRVATLYNMGSGATTADGWPIYYGDVIGDWREEVVYERGTRDGLVIFTTNAATSTRLYTLSQNPLYRNNMTTKGYLQTRNVDYFLGSGMATPPTPNITILSPATASPTIATKASATPNPAAGKTATLSVLGIDDGGEAALTYTWSVTDKNGNAVAGVTFSANGTNAAKNATATFAKSGTYVFTVTARDAGGRTALSNVVVFVNQTLTSVAVTPGSVTVGYNTNHQFTATAFDQFGDPLATQPAFAWTMNGGGGAIDANGLYTPPTTSGSASVRATTGAFTATASVTIKTYTLAAPTALAATVGGPDRVNLSWVDSVSGESAFVIERSTDGTTFTPIGTVPTKITSFAATGLSAGTTYWFRLRSRNGNGNGLPSAPISATTFAAPIAWWRLDESTGTTDLADASGNGRYATARRDPTSAAGRIGNALNFDGNAYVELQNNLQTTAAGSVSLWFKTGTNFSEYAILYYLSSDTYGNGLGSQNELHVNLTSAEKVQLYIRGSASGDFSNDINLASAASYNDNAWHHVAATWDNGTAALYVDGALVASAAKTPVVTFGNTQRTFLGRTNLDTNRFRGLVDDVQLFGPPISAAQATAIYKDSQPPTLATVATASPATTYTRQSTLAALGADDNGESNLTYTWSAVGTPPGAVTFADVNGTNAGKNTLATFVANGTYTLRVTITDAGGRTTTGDVTVTAKDVAAPTSLTATARDAKVTLAWAASSDATSYIVKRSTTAGGPYATVATDVVGTGWVDTSVTNGTGYFYVVSAINGSAASADSNEASATPRSASVPPALTSFAVNYGETQRSMVRTLTLQFDRAVTIAASSLKLTRNGIDASGYLLPAAPDGSDAARYYVRFGGSGIVGGSLPDGRYELMVTGGGVTTADGGAAMPGKRTFEFHQLFGDSDGDADVDNADLFRFRLAQNTSLATGSPSYTQMFDYDLDGDIDNADLFQFRIRQNTTT